MAIGLSYINFTANNWLYTGFLSCHIKIDTTVHRTMVGDSKAVHAQFFSPGEELRNAAHAIKQAILGMNMEVGKLLWHFQNYSMVFPASPF